MTSTSTSTSTLRPGPQVSLWGEDGKSPYQRLSQRMLDVTGDRGVLKDVIREGAGELVAPDASVLVRYSGYLEHMDKPFDSNSYRKTPRLMKLGEDITLWGMELGLLSMRRGELARFLLSPRYAYGALGCPPLIPPEATVLFEIELLDFLDSAESDEFCALSAEQQDQFPLDKVLKVATTEREFGNYLFRQKRFYDAKARYKRALQLLHRRSGPPEERPLVEEARLLVLLNLSLTYLKLERPTAALRCGEQALRIDQRSAKALFRCGQACLFMAEYEKARDFLVRAQREQPCNHDINNELRKLAWSLMSPQRERGGRWSRRRCDLCVWPGVQVPAWLGVGVSGPVPKWEHSY
ncbi:inactive peptidyl-prolyl cis-trans isomerase FKBP6 isoform X1 [Erinaceus europaeus]|uniref:peptidylprolyl isomerase n=1 Tax=Erinaceus europaeus TaxID=9365 RepID=A0ABM3VVE6_ERIEU|nr:inactive peptidyl-prolyl cis-trans isomerase FKBP6 isoform X1 [Erinaceus europaeus]